MYRKHLILACCFVVNLSYFNGPVYAQEHTLEIIKVWQHSPAPFNKENINLPEILDEENKRFSQISEAEIYLYRQPSKQNGPALLYIPGGGYARVSIGTDRGESYAKFFLGLGFTTVAVLKYRLPDSRIVNNQELVPLADAQMALALMHRNADAWMIDRNKIGIKGVSAGGHLAASLNNLTETILAPGVEPDELKQAFTILRAPVISFVEPLRHRGSYKRLLGNNAKNEELLNYYSMEQQVSKDTPPTFLVVAKDDKSVPYENSFEYIKQLELHGVNHEYVLLNKGGHNFGLNRNRVDRHWLPVMTSWLDALLN